MRPESNFPQASYTVQQEDDDLVNSPTYSSLNPSGLDAEINVLTVESNFQINKELLRNEFYAPHNEVRKQWFFENYKDDKRTRIQEEFYAFLNHYQIHVQFFDWFSAYAEQNKIDYPFTQSIFMTKVWQTSSGEKVHSDFPPMRKFEILVNNAIVYAAPFKAKTAVSSEDLLPIIEQNNFTNKYLQVIGEHLSVKIPPSTSSIPLSVVASSLKQPSSYKSALDTPIFKPYEIPSQLRTQISSSKIDSELQTRIDKIEQAIKLAYVPESPTPKTKDDKQKASISVLDRVKPASDSESIPQTPKPESNDIFKLKIQPSSSSWKKSNKFYYPRATHPDVLLYEQPNVIQNSYNANNSYEWNIDGVSEYNITSKLQQMTMVATAYKTSHNCIDQLMAHILVAGFTGQLKSWWDEHLSQNDRDNIFDAIRIDPEGNAIRDPYRQTISDAVSTFIFTIAKTFIGNPGIFREKSTEILNNLKCKKVSEFRWYKDTFLTRIYTRPDGNLPYWKEKFLDGLPKSLRDLVREELQTGHNGIVPYQNITYGELNSMIQQVSMKVCHQDKMMRQLAKDRNQRRKNLGSFCEQFGLPSNQT
ncbi:hypothetical protein ACH5RR_006926 [Cinchona calisaya]|uniref:Uncharacterized protein n=1 Tax=Cinchona calisaya TaxID=153742 RepID=A0ABD3AQH1_9GENT